MAGGCEADGVRDRPGGCATEREVGVVAAVLVAGSEKAAAHRLGLSPSTVKHHLANARSKVGAETTAQLVWILAPRLPEPEGKAQAEEEMPGPTLHPAADH
jgi:DNA-binding CsgD family transcriptional regulator